MPGAGVTQKSRLPIAPGGKCFHEGLAWGASPWAGAACTPQAGGGSSQPVGRAVTSRRGQAQKVTLGRAASASHASPEALSRGGCAEAFGSRGGALGAPPPEGTARVGLQC